MGQAYRRKETSVFLMNYHVVFCPKRRRKILVGPIRDRLMQLIWETAPDLECDVLALEVMPDHIHVFLSATPQWAPNQLIGRIKGKTARLLRQRNTSPGSPPSHTLTQGNYCPSPRSSTGSSTWSANALPMLVTTRSGIEGPRCTDLYVSRLDIVTIATTDDSPMFVTSYLKSNFKHHRRLTSAWSAPIARSLLTFLNLEAHRFATATSGMPYSTAEQTASAFS